MYKNKNVLKKSPKESDLNYVFVLNILFECFMRQSLTDPLVYLNKKFVVDERCGLWVMDPEFLWMVRE